MSYLFWASHVDIALDAGRSTHPPPPPPPPPLDDWQRRLTRGTTSRTMGLAQVAWAKGGKILHCQQAGSHYRGCAVVSACAFGPRLASMHSPPAKYCAPRGVLAYAAYYLHSFYLPSWTTTTRCHCATYHAPWVSLHQGCDMYASLPIMSLSKAWMRLD